MASICTEQEFVNHKRLVGAILGGILLDGINVLVREFPELKPAQLDGLAMTEMTPIEQARTRLDQLFQLDRSIGALMEFHIAMDEGEHKAALYHCCGELLRIQFDLIHQITARYPELDREVVARDKER